jgi:hypothetical protein
VSRARRSAAAPGGQSDLAVPAGCVLLVALGIVVAQLIQLWASSWRGTADSIHAD